MTISATLRTPSGAPLLEGEVLELLGDGRVLATGTVDDNGRVEFPVSTKGITRLAVRCPLDPADAAQS